LAGEKFGKYFDGEIATTSPIDRISPTRIGLLSLSVTEARCFVGLYTSVLIPMLFVYEVSWFGLSWYVAAMEGLDVLEDESSLL